MVKLLMNFTPDNFEKHWPAMMMDVRESMDAYLATVTGLTVEENKLFTGMLYGVLFEPISRLSRSLLSFEFNKTDVEDQRIEKNVEIITLDTHFDSVLEDIRAELDLELSKYLNNTQRTTEEKLNGWLDTMTKEQADKIRDQIVEIIHKHGSGLLDVLFRQITAEIIEITVRFSDRPVAVSGKNGRHVTSSMAAMLKGLDPED